MLYKGNYELFNTLKKLWNRDNVKNDIDRYIKYWKSEKQLLYLLKSGHTTWGRDSDTVLKHVIMHNMVEVCTTKK